MSQGSALVPPGYVTPPFPSFSWDLGNLKKTDPKNLLYYRGDIILFTTLWTIIWFSILFGIGGIWGYLVFRKNRLGILLLLGQLLAGVGLGAASGAVVGAVLGGLYNAGQFGMPTWIPLGWGLVQALVVIVSAYAEISLNTL
ncbi:hypothetical protein SeMB42_g04436 [Synchytrium endobioticum]|uniref:Uncharacterized protein n=1 Tax=Synchytrium endobioticum TaxID=286115 RepID=A0A507CYF7_9FUNG|nr:hypothetical protein SeLEV6574_g04885 [Synchytrium endobioticum]TPX44108.1 hypothetical protein SeMB42_g04436 [Synchytrium endobioticum]